MSVDTVKGRPGEPETMTEGDAGTADAEGIWARTTAPQSAFTARQVGIGFVVLAVGLLVAVGVPLLLV